MNPSFETALSSWHDFYVLMGTGAFTLIGLMFVAVTFGAHLLTEKNFKTARAFLDPTVIHFVQVLVISCLVLLPGIGHLLFGGLLAAVGGLSLGVLVGVHQGLRAAQSQYNDLELADWMSGFIIPLTVYLGYIGCGLAFWTGCCMWVFGLLAILNGVILLNSIYSAWELILWFALMNDRPGIRGKRAKKKR